MPEISIQQQCATLTDLVDAESFGEPIGDLPKQTDSGVYQENNLTAGTWECEPGKLQLDLDITEFCHLLKGHWAMVCARSAQPLRLVGTQVRNAFPCGFLSFPIARWRPARS